MVTIGRKLATALTPPIVLSAARAVKRRVTSHVPVWEIVPGGWNDVRRDDKIRGWNIDSAVAATEVRARNILSANLGALAPFGMTAETADAPAPMLEFHNTATSFAQAFLSSTRMLQRASVLDWGGGLGHYSEICRAITPELIIDYHCSELPEFARRGRELFPAVTFYDDEGWRARTYDFVFSSSSLQYVEQWQSTFRALAEAARGRRLFVTRIPVCFQAPAFVFVQRPYDWGFGTEYAAWCFNRRDFLATEYRGFLFDVPSKLT
jgi:putative methyltransferase (TIGR04325 family)